MAGEAEKVAAVMHEFVDAGAGEQRGRTLLGADEIKRHEAEQAGEDRPGQQLAERDSHRQGRKWRTEEG